MENKIEILRYSDKAIVVTGDTKPVKDKLKELGGKWNGRLTHPLTEDKFGAWIFPKTKEDKVKQALNLV
jgi:hypothetical protein